MAQGNPVKHKKKTKSVLKNIRQTERRAAVNRMNRTRVRTAMRRMRAALGSADSAGAAKLASDTYSELDKTKLFASARFRRTPPTATNRVWRWR
jgi:ribosomal protein S20